MADYGYYFDVLDGKKRAVVETEPQPGFYWMLAGSNAVRMPVAIFTESGDHLIARVGFKGDTVVYRVLQGPTDVQHLNSVWIACCMHPVTKEHYDQAFVDGRWPNDLPAEALGDVPAADRAVARSDNEPPAEEAKSEAEQFKEKIEAAKGVVSGLKIDTDENASKAQAARSRLLELKRQSDERRKTIKEPHFLAAKAVDDEWMPVVNLAETAADGIRKALAAHETRKLQKAREEAEAAAAAAAKSETPPPAEPAPEPAPATTKIATTYGRAASVKMKKVVIILNQDLVYQAFRDNERVTALLKELAQKAVDAGLPMPRDSIKITEEADVR